MALRGKKPTTTEKRLKALFYGAPGVGKTTAAIQFPRPYVIDTEKGAENDQYVKAISDRGGALFQSNDYQEIVDEVTALLSEQHEYRTLVIDPITTVYNDLLNKCEAKHGSQFGKQYVEANKAWRRLYNLLMRLDMNVIVTSHQKKLYGPNMTSLGATYDGPKGADHAFDLVFEVEVRDRERVGIVRKTRVSAFPEEDVFPFSYTEIAKRYGKAILERDAKPEELAKPEQVHELEHLVGVLKLPEDTIEKWLTKASAESFAEMPEASIVKCISWCKDQVNNGRAVKV